MATLNLQLPGIRTADIRTEQDQRQRRAKSLVAERERVIAEMEQIEAVLDVIGESDSGTGGHVGSRHSPAAATPRHPRAVEPEPAAHVRATPVLGGLHSTYEQAA